jgi:hypothetical protein
MADLVTQEAPSGLGQITFTAAAGGGYTVEAGAHAGGWDLPTCLILSHATTGTKTVIVAGHAPGGRPGQLDRDHPGRKSLGAC